MFTEHLETRCKVYNDITVVSWITLALFLIALALVFGSLVSIIISSLFTWKRYIITGLILGGIFFATSTAGWTVLSSYDFKQLGETATYPFPSVSVAFFTACASAVTAGGAAAHLGVLVQSLTAEQEDRVGRKGLLDFFTNRTDEEAAFY